MISKKDLKSRLSMNRERVNKLNDNHGKRGEEIKKSVMLAEGNFSIRCAFSLSRWHTFENVKRKKK